MANMIKKALVATMMLTFAMVTNAQSMNDIQNALGTINQVQRLFSKKHDNAPRARECRDIQQRDNRRMHRECAYPRYIVTDFDVYYDGMKVQGASASTFVSLGHGYGKDAFNVFYDGMKIQGASANSFELLGFGYAKDAFSVFCDGVKLNGASGHSFELLGMGYAKDAFSVFYEGRKVQGASVSSFVVERDGYAHDSFNVYYRGRKLN